MTTEPLPTGSDRPFAIHVMAKPSGSVCNMDCTYCFYLEKEKLYPERNRDWKMDDETLERYVKQYIEAQDAPVANFAWQGGEPTLMGVDFYRKAVELQRQHADGKTTTNALQTNGVLLDDEWGEFLAENRFLVGISIDGPGDLHDRYRVDRGGGPTFDNVIRGLRVLQRHGVEFNTLTVLNSHNVRYPERVYRFLKSEGSRYMQFIPIVERRAGTAEDSVLSLVDPDFEKPADVTEWSVSPSRYGQFLRVVFDEWVRNDVGTCFVQIFDTTLAGWMGMAPGVCVYSETCGDALILEQNGDLYSCDHYVYPDYRLGNVSEKSIREMAESPEQRKFGSDKRDRLPAECRGCEFLQVCHGGCPKHRFLKTSEQGNDLNYLCRGYKIFFGHSLPYMRFMANELRMRRPAAGVMAWAHAQESRRPARIRP